MDDVYLNMNMNINYILICLMKRCIWIMRKIFDIVRYCMEVVLF